MTREKAIDILGQRETCRECVTDCTCKECDEAFDIAIEALEHTRWIPVSERLPEDGTYLICTDDGYISTIMYDRSMGWLLDANIIAWMPLPHPYTPQESEDEE